MKLDFKKAKALLVEYAPGNNDEYEKITTWKELNQAANFELGQASEAERLLSGVVSASAGAIEDHEFDQKVMGKEKVSARFEHLTTEQQDQAREQWEDASSGDGYLYKNHDDFVIEAEGKIVLRSYVA